MLEVDICQIMPSKRLFFAPKSSLSNLFSVLSTVFYYTFLNFGLRNVNINNNLIITTMKKQLFSVMLCLGAMGGLSTFPMPLQAAVSQSQTIKVKGQIVDDQGEPLTGATIKIKGGQGGTVTDLNGNFNLDAPANATLIVSYVGYKDREIAVRGRAIIDPINLSSG